MTAWWLRGFEDVSDGQEEAPTGWPRAEPTATEAAAGQAPRPPGDGRRDATACRRVARAGAPGHPAQPGPGAYVSGLRGTNEHRRVQFAKDALAVCPDCADAYVLLAEHATSRKDALRLYEQRVAAGERALGAEAFGRDVGHFWGLLETRPYMRAGLGLAHDLWTAGRPAFGV
jgi:hypothetical protein